MFLQLLLEDIEIELRFHKKVTTYLKAKNSLHATRIFIFKIRVYHLFQGGRGIHSHFTLYFLSNQNYTKNQFKCMKFLGDVYLYI